MENESETTHQMENGAFAVKKSPRSGRDAATQTPQPVRSHSFTKKSHARAQSRGSSSSDESLVFEDSIAYHPSVKKNEVPFGMPVPDVIVVHSKDTIPLTKEAFTSSPSDGITNLGFESTDEMVRSSSTGNFSQMASNGYPKGPVFLHPNDEQSFHGNNSDCRPVGAFDRRMYYSLPKAPRRKHHEKEKEFKMRSQPPTPQMKRAKTDAVNGDSSTFWIIPREDTSNELNTFSASPSKYVPPEGIGGLYSISGRSTFVSNGYPEPVVLGYEMHHIPDDEFSAESTLKKEKKFEFTPMPASVDRKRRRLQWFTDTLSLMLLIPGILIAVGTPVSLYPLFHVSQKLYIYYLLIFVAFGTLSAVFLALAGILGNIVWHYDKNSKKLKPRLHCGKGPTFHFWGNGFYKAGVVEEKTKEVIV